MRRPDISSGRKNTTSTTNTTAASTSASATVSAASTRTKPSRPSLPPAASPSPYAPAPAPAATPAPHVPGRTVRTRRIVNVATPSTSRTPRQSQTPIPTATTTTALTGIAPRLAPTVAPQGILTQPQQSLHPWARHSVHSARLPTPTNNNNTTTDLTAQSTNAPAATTRASRAPLRSSSLQPIQHVTSLLVKTRSSSASLANMPVGDRPRQPQLSAAAARSINRTPLTPKIAAKGTPVTPLARRPQPSTPTLAGSQNARDDVSSSVSAFLAHNITPRSGPRQSRVDSANTTPNGTPNPERVSDSFENNSVNRVGLGVLPLATDLPRQTTSQVDLASDANDSSKFFYASDVKSIQQAALQRPASVPQKPAKPFFYANGTTADGGRNISPPSTTASIPLMSPSLESAASKFFYANGTPDMSLKPSTVQPASGSAVSSNNRASTSRPPTSNSNTGFGAPTPRPASPIKSASITIAQTQTLRNRAVSPTSPKRTSLVSSPPSVQQPTSSAAKRRISIDTEPKEMGGHRRTASVPGVEPLVLPRFTLSPKPSEPAEASPPLSPGLSQPAMMMASILQAADELQDDSESREEDTDSETPQVPQSPTKSAHFSESVSELVANARRERKVQDLEITNASLEAINRTLERQLRKQTNELRRYRRLSRSGALSAASSRVTSLALTEPPTDMSDVEEEDETEVEDEDLDSFDDSDLSSSDTMSTGSMMLPGAKLEVRRRRDEKRLQLDLTKHQELLIDSQKMNQSLKRCLDFTEALIKEGQKALEYSVRVSDIQLGGRVLAPPDNEDEVSYLEEDTIRSDDHGLEPPWPKSSQDRDSGIELPTEGG